MSQILVIEDAPRLLRSIVRALEESGYSTASAPTLAGGTRSLSSNIDLVVLDLMLPDGNGLDWLSQVRAANNRVPVLILTARDAISDRVAGLDTGADDYLVKPFSLDELLARIRALLRRDVRPEATLLSLGSLSIDLLNRIATREGIVLEL